MKACNGGEDECHSLDRPACCNYHQFGRSNQIIRRRIEATHDDAVVALRRLDVELVLQQEPGGSNRVAEAAEHLRRDKGAWSAPCIRREVYPAEKTEQRNSDSICVSGRAGVTSVARHTSGHWLSPHLPLHGMYPAQHTYLENAQEHKQAWRELTLQVSCTMTEEGAKEKKGRTRSFSTLTCHCRARVCAACRTRRGRWTPTGGEKTKMCI